MSTKREITCSYDGSFAGFLTCVFECFRKKETPVHFLSPGTDQFSLYPVSHIETDRKKAQRVHSAMKKKFSPWARRLVEHGFLCCLPQKEHHIFQYMDVYFREGPLEDSTDDRVLILTKAVQHLLSEAHLLKGFVRFSDYSGVLVGEITPKNRVLPALRQHFCQRYPRENFLLYDRSHKEALCHSKGQWDIIPLDKLTLNRPDETEQGYRLLWRQFYHSISIASRYNPKLRMSNMPKRYWDNMTEFQKI